MEQLTEKLELPSDENLSNLIYSLQGQWIGSILGPVCGVASAIFLSLLIEPSKQVYVGYLVVCTMAVGVVLPILGYIWELRILQRLKTRGVAINQWYGYMLVGLPFLYFGMVTEIACFLASVKKWKIQQH